MNRWNIINENHDEEEMVEHKVLLEIQKKMESLEMECELVCAVHIGGRKTPKLDRSARSRKVVPTRIREHLC